MLIEWFTPEYRVLRLLGQDTYTKREMAAQLVNVSARSLDRPLQRLRATGYVTPLIVGGRFRWQITAQGRAVLAFLTRSGR